MQSLGVEVALARTGVKYLHERALEYDVAIYFEANGHGTVIFSDAAVERLKQVDRIASDSYDGG